MATNMKVYSSATPGLSAAFDISRILELKDRQLEAQRAVLWLDDGGFICDCNTIAMRLLGCRPAGNPPLHISDFLPQLKDMELIHDCHLNSHLRYVAHLGHRFEVVSMHGTRFDGELFFSEVDCPVPYSLRLIIRLHHLKPTVYRVK